MILMKYRFWVPRSLLLFLLLCVAACHSPTRQAKMLVAQLGDTNAERRAQAAKALVAMGPAAIDALVWGISQENPPRIREKAVWTLSDIATPSARVVPALISVLSDPDENVRVAGSIALPQLGEPAVPFLLEALSAASAESVETRLHVAYALGEIGKQLDGEAPLPDIVSALIDSLTDPGWNVRRLVVRALATIGAPAVPALTEALNGVDEELRGMAERALNDIGTPAARQAIAAAKKRFSAE